MLDLVIRVLHELHFVSEQAPLDATTYTLIAPLLSRVVAVGGIGLTDSTSDEAQEQLTLVVGIIASNCGECRFAVTAMLTNSRGGCVPARKHD
jgi:hypothetical protein